MRKQFLSCIAKDSKEYIRSKRNILFSSTLLALCVFVLCSTKLLPGLVQLLSEKASHMIASPDTLAETLNTLFPGNLKANLGIFASDVVVFYGLVAVLSCYNLIPQESRTGRWIFPVGVGYHPNWMVLTKGLVYGCGAAFPLVVFYNLYYFVGSMFLTPDLSWQTALINSAVLGFCMLVIVYLTVILAAISKRPVSTAISVIVTVVAAPDIFSMFAFGRYLPTHLLTYTYTAAENPAQLILPLATTILVSVLCSLLVSGKTIPVETNR